MKLQAKNRPGSGKWRAVALAFSVTAAAASAFADEGQEPGFISHAGNVVRCADKSVQIWAEVGYMGTNGVAWADEAIIKYRIDSRSEGSSRVSGVTAVASSTAHAADDWVDLANQAGMARQSLVAGLDPTNETSTLKATISFDGAGNPVIGFDPARPEWTPADWYEIQGKASLDESSWGSTNSTTRYFRVIINTP